jgi:hypothetical protein
MKKIKLTVLVLMFGVLGLSLYGCANKYNSVPLHSAKYYTKHQKQMAAIIKECNKIHPKIQNPGQLKKFMSSNLSKDCQNANSAEDYLTNQSLANSFAAGW